MEKISVEKTIPQKGYEFAQTILNSISAHVAILDENGCILDTNRAWNRFAQQNQIQMRPDTLAVNYLEICDRADDDAGENPSLVAKGIRDVISGRSEEYVMEYPCHSQDEQRWFYMKVTRAAGSGPLRIVISHENITELKTTQERLRQGEEDLQQEKQYLEEANTALKVLMRQREADRKEMEANVIDNIRHLVAPVIQQLISQNLPERSKKLIATLETRMAEVSKPFLQRMVGVGSMLTPQEIEIATLIREGLSSKEIANQLHLSITTVNFHRRNLRKKLNLRNTRTNLRSHLIDLLK